MMREIIIRPMSAVHGTMPPGGANIPQCGDVVADAAFEIIDKYRAITGTNTLSGGGRVFYVGERSENRHCDPEEEPDELDYRTRLVRLQRKLAHRQAATHTEKSHQASKSDATLGTVAGKNQKSSSPCNSATGYQQWLAPPTIPVFLFPQPVQAWGHQLGLSNSQSFSTLQHTAALKEPKILRATSGQQPADGTLRSIRFYDRDQSTTDLGRYRSIVEEEFSDLNNASENEALRGAKQKGEVRRSRHARLMASLAAADLAAKELSLVSSKMAATLKSINSNHES